MLMSTRWSSVNRGFFTSLLFGALTPSDPEVCGQRHGTSACTSLQMECADRGNFSVITLQRVFFWKVLAVAIAGNMIINTSMTTVLMAIVFQFRIRCSCPVSSGHGRSDERPVMCSRVIAVQEQSGQHLDGFQRAP